MPPDWAIIRASQVGRALPIVAGNTIEVGTIDGTPGGTTALWAYVTISVHASGIAITKLYQIARVWADIGANWYRCLTLTDAVQTANDFDLDLLESGNAFKLRLRRTVGDYQATAAVRIDTNGEFTPTFATSTGATTYAVHPSTALSQRGGLLRTTGLVVAKTTSPVSADLDNGQFSFWLDAPTTTASKIRVTVKDANGTLLSGALNLSTTPP